jgi:hypothetical protein
MSNSNEARKWHLIEFCFENPISKIAIFEGLTSTFFFPPKFHEMYWDSNKKANDSLQSQIRKCTCVYMSVELCHQRHFIGVGVNIMSKSGGTHKDTNL